VTHVDWNLPADHVGITTEMPQKLMRQKLQ